MHKFEIFSNDKLNETIYKTRLKNGLEVYICKKEGYNKKIGLFGTKYGSIVNDFIDINSNKRVKVPDGVAHFLEHKLFEQEGANALDLFAQIGVSSNAYTSFDQTVYYFETIEKFNESISLLTKLVKTPYFTDENVKKEKGIIAQEISMYDDDPNFMCYFNALRGMYNNHPIRIDVAGTVESISNITKETLYTCYNTFYNPSNMFFVVVGDVDEENTVNLIEENIKKYEMDYEIEKNIEIVKFMEKEENKINQVKIEKNMDVYMSQICIGYKLEVVRGNDIIKRQIVCDFISELYFSRLSDFFEEQYNLGLLYEPLYFGYEGSNTFAHLIISASSTNIEKLTTNIYDYINKIKKLEIVSDDFEMIKKKMIAENIIYSESLNSSYRRIIDSIIDNTKLYYDVDVINAITKEDIKKIINSLNDESRVLSIINNK